MLLYKFENSSCKSFIACLLLAPEEDAEDVKTERTTSWYVFVKGLRTGKRKGEDIEQSVKVYKVFPNISNRENYLIM